MAIVYEMELMIIPFIKFYLFSDLMMMVINLETYFLLFKELPEFWSYSILFEAILQKLSYAATVELIPLMEIPGVKQV